MNHIHQVTESPLTFISWWDFLLISLACFIRLFLVMKYKAIELHEKNKDFSIVRYFDFKHVFRWVGHYTTALTLLLTLPSFFEHFIAPKYLPDFPNWSYAGSFCIGFFGYDGIKLLENVTLPLVKQKINQLFKIKVK